MNRTIAWINLNKAGPPTKGVKGAKYSISFPAKMNGKIEVLMEQLNLGRSRVIQLLVEKALREYEFPETKNEDIL